MSEFDCQFDVAEDSEERQPPVSDDATDPIDRVTAHPRDDGLELRSAWPDEWIRTSYPVISTYQYR